MLKYNVWGGLKMTNTNITNFRKDIYRLLENAIKYNEPINVSTKNGNAVILSEEDYNNMMETLYLSSVPELKEEILERKNSSDDNFVGEDEVVWQLYKVEYHKKVQKDIEKLKQKNLSKKAKDLVELIKNNPFQNPPPYEKLLRRFKRSIFKKNKYTAQACV